MSEIIITKKELSLVSDNTLNESQLQLLLKPTPAKYVKQRPGKGGGTWDYVSGGYVKKVLNLMFGWDWDFEIVNQMVLHGEAIVQGKLTVRTNGKTIVKTQFGNKDIICKKGTEIPLSIGNDLKAATTDCLKKCAAELGIAADIYNKEEFTAVTIVSENDLETQHEIISAKYAEVMFDIPQQQTELIERVIANKEYKSYHKVLSIIESYENR